MSNNDSSVIEAIKVLTKNGYRCKNCGVTDNEHPKFYYYQNHLQEDSHIKKKKIILCSKRLHRYKYSRKNCPGFYYSKKDLAEIEKKEKDLKELEQAFIGAIDEREKINDAIGKHW